MKPKKDPPASSPGGYWPNHNQTLLLQAALFQGERAINAWQQWKTTTDIEVAKLDLSSFRLLPQVYRNLYHQGVNEPLIEKLKGIYRLHWYQNQRLFHHMTPLLKSLQAAGVKTMILKGAALSLCYYQDYGLRPMEDFDVLVPTRKAQEALFLLKDLGWHSKAHAREVLTEDYRAIWHSHALRDGSDYELDLHWHLLFGFVTADADSDFWEGATEVSLPGGVPTLTLNPTDQLLHVCAHGAVWDTAPHLRWVSDAITILRVAKSEIDWRRLLRHVQKHRLTVPLREALRYLQGQFDAPVPAEVVSALEDIPVSKREYRIYRYTISPPTLLSVLAKIWLLQSHLTKEAGLWKRLVQFSRHLPYWGMPSLWKLPFYVSVRAIKKGLRKIPLLSKRVKHHGQ